MRLPISTTAMLLFSLSTLSLASAQPHSLPFNTTYLFTAKVLLGAPPTDPSKNPVTIPGGAIVPEPILGGTVTGPYLNANITSGLATPRVYRNGTLQQPVIDLYGVAEGGVPLVLHETGIGAPEAQVTRLVSWPSSAATFPSMC